VHYFIFTRSAQLIFTILLQHHISTLPTYFWSITYKSQNSKIDKFSFYKFSIFRFTDVFNVSLIRYCTMQTRFQRNRFFGGLDNFSFRWSLLYLFWTCLTPNWARWRETVLRLQVERQFLNWVRSNSIQDFLVFRMLMKQIVWGLTTGGQAASGCWRWERHTERAVCILHVSLVELFSLDCLHLDIQRRILKTLRGEFNLRQSRYNCRFSYISYYAHSICGL
jgi:hypothetical protein